MKVWTTNDMNKILTKYDDQVCKALVKLYNYQTADEQKTGKTKENNGVGFNGVDSEILTGFVKFYQEFGFLTPKQMIIARKKIMKYSAQLCRIVNQEV